MAAASIRAHESRGMRGMSGPVCAGAEEYEVCLGQCAPERRNATVTTSTAQESRERAATSALGNSAVHKYVCAQIGPRPCGSQIVSKLMIFVHGNDMECTRHLKFAWVSKFGLL